MHITVLYIIQLCMLPRIFFLENHLIWMKKLFIRQSTGNDSSLPPPSSVKAYHYIIIPFYINSIIIYILSYPWDLTDNYNNNNDHQSIQFIKKRLLFKHVALEMFFFYFDWKNTQIKCTIKLCNENLVIFLAFTEYKWWYTIDYSLLLWEGKEILLSSIFFKKKKKMVSFFSRFIQSP